MLLVLFIWKVLPRLNQLLDERSKAIAGRIDEAKHAREEAERVLQQYQEQLAEARTEARPHPRPGPRGRQADHRRAA